MALKVWLPLNGSLENIGISDVTVTNNGATVDNNGKIGKCYSFNGSSYMTVPFDATNLQEHFSIAVWVKFPDATSGNKQIIAFSSNSGWGNVRCTMLYRTASARALFSISDGTNYVGYNFNITITPNVWQHLCVTFKDKVLTWYLNGEFQKTYTTSYNPKLNDLSGFGIGGAYNGAEKFTGYLNDVRIYDHCLSAKEVKEIAQGLILHYKLNGLSGGVGDNLMLGTMMTQTPIRNSTDYTNTTHIRYYNTSASNCTITNNEATILLNSTSNLGIAFERLANEINFDTNAYYTLSCEAKTSMSGAQLAIGTSYYNTSDVGVWRGGSNKKAFTSLDNWQTFSITFKPDADIKAICYCFTINGVAGGTDTAIIRHCKLEKGSVVTAWSPAPEDLDIDTTKITDSSGYGHDGIANGALTTAAESGRYNNATYIPMGSTDYIITQDAIGNPTDAITMNIWFNSSNLTPGNNYHEIFNHATNSQYFEFAIYKNGYFRGGMVINGTSYVNNTAQLGLLDGNWHMLSMTYDGHTIIRYVDGISRSTTSITGELTGANAKFLLGHYGPNTTYYAKEAYLSDARIYATALSAEDILDLYHTPANIDDLGGLHGFEMVEDGSTQSITQNGQIVNQGSTKTYLVNNFTETGTTTNWTFGGTNSIANGIVTLEGVNPTIVSSWFTVNPEDIIAFEGEIWLPTPSTSSGAAGLYLGTPNGASYATTTYLYNWTTNTWSTSNTNNTNPYFIQRYNLTNHYQFKTYILGSDMTIDDIPMAKTNNTARGLYAIKLNSATTARIRSGYNTNTSMQICLYDFKIYNIHDDGFCEINNDAKIGQGYYRFSNFIEK